MAIDTHYQVQVAILGGGCGGLWLLDTLSREYNCLLIEYSKLGRFASTKNQSWLHTGALFAALFHRDKPEWATNMIRACKEGYQRIKQSYGNSVEGNESSGCIYLFTNPGNRQAVHEFLNHSEVYSTRLTEDELFDKEPVLTPTRTAYYGLLTEDLPFDSYQILCQLKDHAYQNGGNFHRCSVEISDDRFTISPVRDTGYYRIEEPSGFQAEAQIVVCAAGVLNSVIFNRIVGGSDKNGMKLREFLVTVLHQRICNRILFIQNPLNSGFLSLVPFISGTTISSNLLCRNITNVRDTAFTDDASEERSSMIAERLTKFTPGMVGNASIGTHFYVCQRLINTAHDTNRYLPCTYSDYHYFWIEAPKNIFYFYPGLFTLAPVGAQKLAAYLSERLDKKQIRRIGSGPMDVSHRPYFNRVTHIARTTYDKLRFEKIEG